MESRSRSWRIETLRRRAQGLQVPKPLLDDQGPNRGLDVYRSENLESWTYQGKILDKPGRRNDDATVGKHCDVVVCGPRAYIIYLVEPGMRDVPPRDGIQPLSGRRSALQAAELEVQDGKLVCDRDKLFRMRLTPPDDQ